MRERWELYNLLRNWVGWELPSSFWHAYCKPLPYVRNFIRVIKNL